VSELPRKVKIQYECFDDKRWMQGEKLLVFPRVPCVGEAVGPTANSDGEVTHVMWFLDSTEEYCAYVTVESQRELSSRCFDTILQELTDAEWLVSHGELQS
jgi:hypothetical protein